MDNCSFVQLNNLFYMQQTITQSKCRVSQDKLCCHFGESSSINLIYVFDFLVANTFFICSSEYGYWVLIYRVFELKVEQLSQTYLY